MRELVHSNHLPDYTVTLEDGQAVFWRRSAEAPKSLTQPASSSPDLNRPRRITISQWAFDRLREQAPRWDKHMLESQYIEWAKTKDAALNGDARFLGWAKSYIKGKAAP